ncbi:hypothetical protein [Streptomyces sp. NPDC059970]|uniref:hypothetical protein n=1 Tax=Streptomyces sp. NPDC059970 TaxID=3347019 RepID=UPI003699C2B7
MLCTGKFSAASPLRELADLKLTLPPLGFRQAARLWGIDEPGLALLVHAVVGETPAHWRYVGTSSGPDDFDAWACRTILIPGLPAPGDASPAAGGD